MRRLPSVCLLLAACGGGDPADVAGDYTVAVVNEDNGCDFADWTGNTAQDIPVEITQNGAAAAADVGGGAGIALDLVLGHHVFTGEVDGNHLSLAITGDVVFMQNECDYTFDAELEADLDGDALDGDIFYRAITDGDPDCGDLTGCVNRQAMNGIRPPS